MALKIKHSVSDNFSKKLHSYQQRNILCDVEIFTRDGCVRAHRVVLAAASPYLSLYEESGRGSGRNYICPLDSVKTIEKVLNYLYTGELIFDESEFQDILQLCKGLKLNIVVDSLHDKYGKEYKAFFYEDDDRTESDVQGQKQKSCRIMPTSDVMSGLVDKFCQNTNSESQESTVLPDLSVSTALFSNSSDFLGASNKSYSQNVNLRQGEMDFRNNTSGSILDRNIKQNKSEEVFMHIVSSQEEDSDSDQDVYTDIKQLDSGNSSENSFEERPESVTSNDSAHLSNSKTDDISNKSIDEKDSEMIITVTKEKVDTKDKRNTQNTKCVSKIEPASIKTRQGSYLTGDLKVKIIANTSEKLKCFVCEMVASSYTHLCNHLSEVHQKRCFRCSDCGQIFETAKDKNRHRRKDHRSKDNEDEGDNLSCKQNEIRPSKVKKSDIFKCRKCSKKFSSEGALDKHTKTGHCKSSKDKTTTKVRNVNYNCLKCSCEFYSDESFINHIKSNNCSVPNEGEETHPQPRVEYYARKLSNTFHVPVTSFSSVDTITSKIPLDQKNVINVGSRKKKGPRVTDKKIEGKINVYRCFICKEEFLDSKSCVDHRQVMHPGNSKQNKSCDICGTYQGCWINLVEHKFKTHGILDNPEKYTMLKCEHQGCDYITLSKDRLREHSNVHAEKELCPVCNKSVCKGKAMKTHMRNHADPSVTCEKCGGSFKNRHSLKIHLKNLHTEKGLQKRFMCHLCPTSVRHRAEMNEHILQVHKEVPHGWEDRLQSCPKCDFRTFLPVKVRKHELLHQKKDNPESVPKTPCEVCGTLVFPQYYKRHFKEVHSEKNIKCVYEGCSFTTSLEKRMNLHVYNHHTNKDFKPYSCHLCDYRAKIRGNLTKHLANKHQYEDMTLAKRRKLALETGENFPSTVVGNRAIDNDVMDYNLGHL